MRTRSRLLLVALVALAVLCLACGLGDAISDLATPDGRITEASRTPECRQELRAALQRHATEQGMAFETTDEMLEQLITGGDTSVEYVRDGTTYTPHFAIDASDGQCRLAYYRLTTERPGQTNTQLFEHPIQLTSACACELPPSQ